MNDPAKAALLRYYAWTLRRRQRAEARAERLVRAWRQREAQALAQLAEYQRDQAPAFEDVLARAERARRRAIGGRR